MLIFFSFFNQSTGHLYFFLKTKQNKNYRGGEMAQQRCDFGYWLTMACNYSLLIYLFILILYLIYYLFFYLAIKLVGILTNP